MSPICFVATKLQAIQVIGSVVVLNVLMVYVSIHKTFTQPVNI